ncbi:5-formyltetrahydrofolate cyclo-ligase [Herbinix luporum]|jgi:5-formyltetrahydrofolate cyclo-ligase|uniref:5-formyltetrahydrofolate cyclo-ligase n=1 Tax=Herbinix luporum TaxID=1679721 RepID=A0A0K8J555_9FIRM|nr:5-formyltetrahydrofolate cyclo-ligase [Herbinix luporum]MDI9488642.1 5-formyltetrahydrofolate cyclo-ligase [Bacillota bacterium]CUH92610.1 hypothetical protein SD1D_1064 [Herbinix luporum]HHT56751.1 5-formyltetrahydrofolate cyclo-ligase [Herbinix luporum]
MTKNEIRSLIKEKRNNLTLRIRREYDKDIHERLFELPEFKDCNKLFTYVSFGSEVDTFAIINKALGMKKEVYIPKVEGKNLNFYKINKLEGLVRSKFGILEPEGINNPYLASHLQEDNKLMLLPGLAFDKYGNRIGYGAGYYDRYLGAYSINNWIKIALAYDFQIMDRLNVNEYDIRTDYIVTDKRVISCN